VRVLEQFEHFAGFPTPSVHVSNPFSSGTGCLSSSFSPAPFLCPGCPAASSPRLAGSTCPTDRSIGCLPIPRSPRCPSHREARPAHVPVVHLPVVHVSPALFVLPALLRQVTVRAASTCTIETPGLFARSAVRPAGKPAWHTAIVPFPPAPGSSRRRSAQATRANVRTAVRRTARPSTAAPPTLSPPPGSWATLTSSERWTCGRRVI